MSPTGHALAHLHTHSMAKPQIIQQVTVEPLQELPSPYPGCPQREKDLEYYQKAEALACSCPTLWENQTDITARCVWRADKMATYSQRDVLEQKKAEGSL